MRMRAVETALSDRGAMSLMPPSWHAGEGALRGHETGRIVRTEAGEYIEVHQPLTEQEP
jgi:hypothetical protein